jgi:hypothetical protein
VPGPPPPPPDNARGYLHLAAIGAWQAIACRRPAPDMGPSVLFREMPDVFGAGSAISPPVGQLIGEWWELAPERGIAVAGGDEGLRPGIGQAITRTVTASIWVGVTTGCLTLTGGQGIPDRLTMYLRARPPNVRALGCRVAGRRVESPKITRASKSAGSART